MNFIDFHLVQATRINCQNGIGEPHRHYGIQTPPLSGNILTLHAGQVRVDGLAQHSSGDTMRSRCSKDFFIGHMGLAFALFLQSIILFSFVAGPGSRYICKLPPRELGFWLSHILHVSPFLFLHDCLHMTFLGIRTEAFTEDFFLHPFLFSLLDMVDSHFCIATPTQYYNDFKLDAVETWVHSALSRGSLEISALRQIFRLALSLCASRWWNGFRLRDCDSGIYALWMPWEFIHPLLAESILGVSFLLRLSDPLIGTAIPHTVMKMQISNIITTAWNAI